MPRSDEFGKCLVGFCQNIESPVLWICFCTRIVDFATPNSKFLQNRLHLLQFYAVFLRELDIESCIWRLRHSTFGIKVPSHIRYLFRSCFQKIGIIFRIEKPCRCFQHMNLTAFAFLIHPRLETNCGKQIAQSRKPSHSLLRDAIRIVQFTSSTVVKRPLQIGLIFAIGHRTQRSRRVVSTGSILCVYIGQLPSVLPQRGFHRYSRV